MIDDPNQSPDYRLTQELDLACDCFDMWLAERLSRIRSSDSLSEEEVIAAVEMHEVTRKMLWSAFRQGWVNGMERAITIAELRSAKEFYATKSKRKEDDETE